MLSIIASFVLAFVIGIAMIKIIEWEEGKQDDL